MQAPAPCFVFEVVSTRQPASRHASGELRCVACRAASEEDAEQAHLGSKARSTKQLSDTLTRNHAHLSSLPTDTVVTLLKCLDRHIRDGRDTEMQANEEVSFFTPLNAGLQ